MARDTDVVSLPYDANDVRAHSPSSALSRNVSTKYGEQNTGMHGALERLNIARSELSNERTAFYQFREQENETALTVRSLVYKFSLFFLSYHFLRVFISLLISYFIKLV